MNKWLTNIKTRRLRNKLQTTLELLFEQQKKLALSNIREILSQHDEYEVGMGYYEYDGFYTVETLEEQEYDFMRNPLTFDFVNYLVEYFGDNSKDTGYLYIIRWNDDKSYAWRYELSYNGYELYIDDIEDFKW